MKKIFQTYWHGILFRDIAKTSTKKLADAEFYEEFYKVFLAKHKGWEDLDPKWVKSKLTTIQLIKSRFGGNTDAKILSLSCGIGFIEKELINSGFTNLDITETSELPLKWIKQIVPQNRIFTGFFPGCIPKNSFYDFIYISGSEYFLNQQELMALLNNAKSRLVKGGKVILISFSFESSAIVDKIKILAKSLIKYLLGCLRIKERGQFWGYSRTRGEFNGIMNKAGYLNIRDGLIQQNKENIIYWIEGEA